MIAGILQNVDSATGEITITLENGQTATFTIGNDSPIETEDATSSIESLEPGTAIELSVGSNGNVTQRVQARLAKIEGHITATDASQITITTENGRSRTLTVSPDTRIELEEDFPGTLADLTIGTPISARFDPSTLAAFKISIGIEVAEIEGLVAEVTDQGFVIETPRGRRLALTVTEGTRFEDDDGAFARLSDLLVGAEAEVEFDPFSRTVILVEFEYETPDEPEDDDDDE